ncbi:phage protease, partial [Kingella kingae]|uniref:phage protease n=1 Tax=Kingella kingae TaxID=504 RepID=UPI002351D3A0
INQSKENPMNELLQQLFGLPHASEAELTAALTALLAAKPQDVALSADVFAQLADKDNKIAALTAGLQTAQPDLTQYAPVSVVQDLQNQVAALTAQRDADKGADLIQAALTAGKLLPAQKEWAQNVLKQPNGLAFLTSFVDNAQPIAALTQAQTAAQNVSGSLKTVALSAEQKAACKMLGMSEEEFAQINQTEKDSK